MLAGFVYAADSQFDDVAQLDRARQEMIADLAPKRPVPPPPAPDKSDNADAWWLRKK